MEDIFVVVLSKFCFFPILANVTFLRVKKITVAFLNDIALGSIANVEGDKPGKWPGLSPIVSASVSVSS